MSNEFCIIGGNVAGIGTALYLKNKFPEANIQIFEPRIFNKPCGGAISIEWYEYLKEEFNIQLDEAYLAPKMRTGLWSGRYIEVDSPFILTTRKELQEKLIDKAREENIEIVKKEIKITDENLFTPQTIVAAGYSGISRKLMQQEWKPNDTVQVLRFDGYVKCSHPDVSTIILDNKQLGYGWLFVGSKNHINVGLGGMGKMKTINSRYYEFLDLLDEKYDVHIPPEKVKPQGWGLPLPISKSKYKIVNKLPEYPDIEFIGVGDAIGLAHPILGAGIEPGWQSGWILAESFDKTTRTLDTKRYETLLNKNLSISSNRRLDRFLATTMRNKWVPWKDKFGYIGLRLFMNRMISKMREYPWYAFVADETGPLHTNKYNSTFESETAIVN